MWNLKKFLIESVIEVPSDRYIHFYIIPLSESKNGELTVVYYKSPTEKK